MYKRSYERLKFLNFVRPLLLTQTSVRRLEGYPFPSRYALRHATVQMPASECKIRSSAQGNVPAIAVFLPVSIRMSGVSVSGLEEYTADVMESAAGFCILAAKTIAGT